MLRILFIDDEPIRAYGLVQRGHAVFCVDGLPVFLFYMQANVFFDVVCLDHDMPRGEGRLYLPLLQERNIPVIVHSTNYDAARRMTSALEEFAVPVKQHSILERDFIEVVEAIAEGAI